MKTLFALSLCVLAMMACANANAQVNSFTGDIEITVPAATDGQIGLTVTNAGTIAMGLNNTGATNAFGAPANYTYVGGTNGFDLVLTTMGTGRMFLDTAGNVGIGTPPASKLTIQDTVYPTSFTGSSSNVGIGNNIQNGQFAKLTFGNGNGNFGGIGLQVTGGGSYLYLGTSNNYNNGITNSALVIDPSGNIGIGIIAPTNKLTVAGVISAQEIKVTTSGADYVFDDGYKLRPLDEVAAFIGREKHLPDIVSAKEMQANGLPVSEQVTRQLAKIEELTLYLIKMDQEITDLKKENNLLKARLDSGTVSE